MGWIDNIASADPSKFHVKFDVSDLDVKVNQNQLYNHFADNREITTKAGLCKNLWNLCPYESQLQVSHLFPRCYDLSDARQTVAPRPEVWPVLRPGPQTRGRAERSEFAQT